MNIILKKENREIFWKFVGLDYDDIRRFIEECDRIGWDAEEIQEYECDRIERRSDYLDSLSDFNNNFNWSVL